MIDPSPNADSSETYREPAVNLCLMLATHFGRSLKVKTRWAKTAAALQVACVNTQDGDIEGFINVCLEGVKANPAYVAADSRADKLITRLTTKSVEWRLAFIRYVATRTFPVIVFARKRWEEVKEQRLEKVKQIAIEQGDDPDAEQGEGE